AMLESLRDSGWLTERKARLFAVACCRRLRPLPIDEISLRAVEVAEQYAEGAASWDELTAARTSASAAAWGDVRNAAVFAAAERPSVASELSLYYVGCATARYAEPNTTADEARRAARKPLASVLRDIVGNPFRPVTLDSAWLTPAVRALAQG